MLIVVFNIGNLTYSNDAIEVLKDYFNKYNLKYEIVTDLKDFNIKNVHPSWMKLLVHNMFPNQEFILTWDIDLLPIRNAPNIELVIDKTKLNMAYDSSVVLGYQIYRPNFKYNGGLIGIPQSFSKDFETLYHICDENKYPSYEQYHLNDYIESTNCDVHRIPDEYNTLYPKRNDHGWDLWNKAILKHHSFGGIENPPDMNEHILKHKLHYFGKEVYIIGKNATILTYPEGFFDNKFTIGINHAAITFNTKMAFSCYPFKIKEFLSSNIPIERIIGVLPHIKPEGIWATDLYPNYFPGILNDPIHYHNTIRLDRKDIDDEMRILTSGNKRIPYHNNGTALQMLIYWCVLHGYGPIHLCGCNQTTDCASNCKTEHCKKTVNGFCVDPKIWEDSRQYTKEVVRCLNKYGEKIILYENFEDYIKINGVEKNAQS